MADRHNGTYSGTLVSALMSRQVSGPIPITQLAVSSIQFYSRYHLYRSVLCHNNQIYCALFDQTGRYIVTGADDHLAKIWSADDGRLLVTLRGIEANITDIAIDVENSMIVTGANNGLIHVWCLQTSAPIAILDAESEIKELKFCPLGFANDDERFLVSSAENGHLNFWSYNPKTRNFDENPNPLTKVICFAFSTGGGFLAVGSTDFTVRFYLVKNDRKLLVFILSGKQGPKSQIDSIVFSHHSLRFASASKNFVRIWNYRRRRLNSIQLNLWQNLTGDLPAVLPVDNRNQVSIAWTNDDEYLITTSPDSAIRVWNSITGDLCRLMLGHNGSVSVIECHPKDTRLFLTAGTDGIIMLWDVLKGVQIKRIYEAAEQILECRFSPDGLTIVATDSDGQMIYFGMGETAIYDRLPGSMFFHTDFIDVFRDENNQMNELEVLAQNQPHLLPQPPILVDEDQNAFPNVYQRLVPGRENNTEQELTVALTEYEQRNRQQPDPENENAPNQNIQMLNVVARDNQRQLPRIVPKLSQFNIVSLISTQKLIARFELEYYKQEKATISEPEAHPKFTLDGKKRKLSRKPIVRSTYDSDLDHSDVPMMTDEDNSNDRDFVVSHSTNSTSYSDPDTSPGPSQGPSTSRNISRRNNKRNKRNTRKKSNYKRKRISSLNVRKDEVDETDDDASDSTNGRRLTRSHKPSTPTKRQPKVIIYSSSSSSKEEDKPNDDDATVIDSDQFSVYSGSLVPVFRESSKSGQAGLEWLTNTKPKPSLYFPQIGDSVVYLRAGHAQYLEYMKQKNVHSVDCAPFSRRGSDSNNIDVDEIFVRLRSVKFTLAPQSSSSSSFLPLVTMQFVVTDDDESDDNRLVAQEETFKVKYCYDKDFDDFIILRKFYDSSVGRILADFQRPGARFRSIVNNQWHYGRVKAILNLQTNFKCYEVVWDISEGAVNRSTLLSVWDMVPLSGEEDPAEGLPVTEEELAQIVRDDSSLEVGERNRLFGGLVTIMQYPHSEPFIGPFDLAQYDNNMIAYPMDLATIRDRLQFNYYRHEDALINDVQYLEANAKRAQEPVDVITSATVVTKLLKWFIKDRNCNDITSLYSKVNEKLKQLKEVEEEEVSSTEDEEKGQIRVSIASTRKQVSMSAKSTLFKNQQAILDHNAPSTSRQSTSKQQKACASKPNQAIPAFNQAAIGQWKIEEITKVVLERKDCAQKSKVRKILFRSSKTWEPLECVQNCAAFKQFHKKHPWVQKIETTKNSNKVSNAVGNSKSAEKSSSSSDYVVEDILAVAKYRNKQHFLVEWKPIMSEPKEYLDKIREYLVGLELLNEDTITTDGLAQAIDDSLVNLYHLLTE